MKNTVSKWLFANALIKRDRSQSETLLLGAIENMLVQAFLLLSDQSFLECHLRCYIMRISQLLIQKVVHRVALQLPILANQVLLTLQLLLLQPLRHGLQIFANVAAQDLLF